jgi:hypothetical protein
VADIKSLREVMEAFAPYYVGKDSMHGLAHIGRLLRSAYWLMEHYPADEVTVVCAT